MYDHCNTKSFIRLAHLLGGFALVDHIFYDVDKKAKFFAKK